MHGIGFTRSHSLIGLPTSTFDRRSKVQGVRNIEPMQATTSIYNGVNPVPLRRMVYALLTTIAVGYMAGRILASVPTMSDNDSSRWDTVRALVDEGTYAIGVRSFNRASSF